MAKTCSHIYNSLGSVTLPVLLGHYNHIEPSSLEVGQNRSVQRLKVLDST